MTEESNRSSDLRANRRREIFKVARGSRLTERRGTLPGVAGTSFVADARSVGAPRDSPPGRQRIHLGGTVEDEFEDSVIRNERRYTEPND